MNEVQIECQGLPCPQPVIKCKEAIEAHSPQFLSVIVDNEAAKENVFRFMTIQGYTPSTNFTDGNYIVSASKSGSTDGCEECTTMSRDELAQPGQQKQLIFIATDAIGSGDDELGRKLMHNFLLTLREMGSDLWRIIMVNGGVKLAVQGSDSLAVLQQLEKEGVSILVCGTCLEHFNLTSTHAVGDVTNMLDIITSFQLATKTIRV